MKKTLLILGFAFMAVLSACQFSVGTKKDLKTGLAISYNGFSVEDVFLTNGVRSRLSTNKIPIDSTFSIIATGVGNYKLKDGKAYPGCELTIKDKSGKVMGNAPDLMAEVSRNGLDPAGATTLSATLTLHAPFVAGETYHVTARFFDKENPKNQLTADVNIALQ